MPAFVGVQWELPGAGAREARVILPLSDATEAF
jgi:hypothetical protein